MNAGAEVLLGTPGAAEGGVGPKRWCTAWLDLHETRDFASSTTLNVQVLGQQDNVLVRLLRQGASPTTSAGIIGGIRKIPQNGVIQVRLTQMYKDIKQISVHGCSEAFKIKLPGNPNHGTIAISGAHIRVKQ